jgi:hypothetical protein
LTTKNKFTFFPENFFSSCKLNEELGRTDEHSIPNTSFIYKNLPKETHTLKLEPIQQKISTHAICFKNI